MKARTPHPLDRSLDPPRDAAPTSRETLRRAFAEFDQRKATACNALHMALIRDADDVDDNPIPF
jgi:hypothetical protein